MRLAFVYDAVHPWVPGGVQRRVWELAHRLAAEHDVHWYGFRYWDGPPVIEREDVTLHGVAEPPDLYVDGRRSITAALSFAARLVRPLRRESFDLVDYQAFPYFPAFPGKLDALLDDATMVVTWHEVWNDYWYEYLGRKGVFGKAVERMVARLPDAHLAVSERTRRDLADVGVRGAELLPNGIDLAAVEDVDPADEHVDVLFVGRLIEQKGVGMLVEAVDRIRGELPGVTCLVVGEGPERDRIERLIRSRGLDGTVRLLDFRESHEDVLGLMKAADVFALPSRREGFGMTVLEALACGTAVVTTRHPRNAATELVEDGTSGRIVDRTPGAVASGVLEAREAVASADCVAAARAYDWDRIAGRAGSLYRERV